MKPPRIRSLSDIVTRQDFWVGLAVIGVGVAGLLHIAYGDWRPGPAVGPHAFPQLAYITLIVAGAIISAGVAIGIFDAPLDRARGIITTGIAVLIIGATMFWLARNVGVFVSTAATLLFAAFVLTPQPLKHWPSTIVVPLVSAAVIYVLFVMVINVPISGVLLF